MILGQRGFELRGREAVATWIALAAFTLSYYTTVFTYSTEEEFFIGLAAWIEIERWCRRNRQTDRRVYERRKHG